MFSRISLVAAAVLLSGCPSPSPLDSVDGLAGGELTSDVKVPTLSATKIEADELVAGSSTLSEVTAETVATAALSADDVTTTSLTSEKITMRGYALFGAPIGTATFSVLNNGAGYRAADGRCREDFGPAAHVCSAEEALTAYRAGVDPPAALSGAAVVTGGFYTSVRLFAGGAETDDTYFVVDDCDGWRETSTFNSALSLGTGALSATYGSAHTYLALVHDEASDTWRLAPTFTSANCSEVTLACCG